MFRKIITRFGTSFNDRRRTWTNDKKNYSMTSTFWYKSNETSRKHVTQNRIRMTGIRWWQKYITISINQRGPPIRRTEEKRTWWFVLYQFSNCTFHLRRNPSKLCYKNKNQMKLTSNRQASSLDGVGLERPPWLETLKKNNNFSPKKVSIRSPKAKTISLLQQNKQKKAKTIKQKKQQFVYV